MFSRAARKFPMRTAPREQIEVPTISIGLPVYNGERFIREALDSVLRQTFTDFELIISDNNSSDTTQEICRSYAARDWRLKYIRQEKNQGGFWNFCFVAQQAMGQFFTWLAHDDILEPQFLERTVQYMLRNPRTVVATSDFAIIDESGSKLRIDKLDELRDSLCWEIRRMPFFEFAYPNIHLCFYGLIQTKVCKSVLAELREPKMMTGSEHPFLARFAAAGEIVALPEVLRKYRSHDAGVYLTEVANIERMPSWRGIIFVYGNRFKLRMDLFKVLLGAPYTWKSKLRILRRVMILDFQWWRWKITGHWTDPKTITEEARDYGETDARGGHLQ
jgi:glycosyltransferase involved in cell wall biosynthesis